MSQCALLQILSNENITVGEIVDFHNVILEKMSISNTQTDDRSDNRVSKSSNDGAKEDKIDPNSRYKFVSAN